MAAYSDTYRHTKAANEANWEEFQRETDYNFDYWKQEQDYNFQIQQQLFQMQSDEWNRQFNAQNAYNDPKAQMERLLNAGLNPQLAAGTNGGVAQGGSFPSVPSPGEAPQLGTGPHGSAASFRGDSTADTLKALSEFANTAKGIYDSSDLNPEKATQRQTMSGIVQALALKNVGQELQNNSQSLQNYVYSHTSSYQIKKAYNDMLLSYNQAALAGEQVQTERDKQFDLQWDAFYKMAQRNFTDLEGSKLLLQMPFVRQEMINGINLLRAQTRQANTQAEVNIQSERLTGFMADIQSLNAKLNTDEAFRDDFINRVKTEAAFYLENAAPRLKAEFNQLVSMADRTKYEFDNYWTLKLFGLLENLTGGAGTAAAIVYGNKKVLPKQPKVSVPDNPYHATGSYSY